MKSLVNRLLLVAFAWLLVCPVSVANAQAPQGGRGRRVLRSLFGPTEAQERRAQQVNLTLFLYNAFDDNSRFEADNDLLDATLQSKRMFQGAGGTFSFSRRRPRATITAGGSAGFRYYSALRSVTTSKFNGSAGMDVQVSPRLRVQGSQAFSYSPYYQLALGQSAPALGGTEIPTASADYSVARERVIGYTSVAGATYQPGRRSTLTFGYGLQYTDFLGSGAFSAQRGGGRYEYELWDGIALRLGYGLAVSRDRSAAPAVLVHNIDLGVDYRRSIALSPRTSVALSTGTTVVSAADGRHVQVGGMLRVDRQLFAGWRAQAGYERGVQVLENTPVPFFSGTFTGGISGQITRRMSLRSVPIYSTGAAVGDRSMKYHSVSATTRLDIAVTRHWALYGEHFYYRYQFPQGTGLPAVLTDGLQRQGLRGGLTLWVPVLR